MLILHSYNPGYGIVTGPNNSCPGNSSSSFLRKFLSNQLAFVESCGIVPDMGFHGHFYWISWNFCKSFSPCCSCLWEKQPWTLKCQSPQVTNLMSSTTFLSGRSIPPQIKSVKSINSRGTSLVPKHHLDFVPLLIIFWACQFRYFFIHLTNSSPPHQVVCISML